MVKPASGGLVESPARIERSSCNLDLSQLGPSDTMPRHWQAEVLMQSMDRRSLLRGVAALGMIGMSAPAAAGYKNKRVDGPGYVVSGVKKWLLPQFGDVLRSHGKGTPFSLALICAMAYQESGYRWWRSAFRGKQTPTEVLRLLVLDDASPRKSLKLTRDMASFKASPTYGDLTPGLVAAANAAREAAKDPDEKPFKDQLRFGYGLFQYDLQNIESDPHFWVDPAPGLPAGQLGLWGDIEASTSRFMDELRSKYHGDIYRAVHDYNGGGDSADIYLYNVRVYEQALIKESI